MTDITGFGAREYFASHNPRQCRRMRRRREMTPHQRALFEEGMDLLRRGVPIEAVEARISKEAAR